MALYNMFNTGQVGQQQPLGAAAAASVPATTPQFGGLAGQLTAQPAPTPSMSGVERVQSSLQAFMDPRSDYIQDARQRGYEYAQSRGGINSSIAAGAAEREARSAAGQLASEATAIEQQRENLNMENWLNTQNFNRAMFGQFQQGAFQNSLSMLNALQQYSMEDPELYTPDVVSGMGNFFNQNMMDQLSRYFQ